MSENFRKIKKKYLTAAIVAGCILGICLGVAVTCALAVVLKTCGIALHWAIYIPIALAVSAGAGCLFFLILRPDDKRIAKKLDKDFALNQKVQTMVEFAGVEGDLPALQREQTDEALGEVAQKRIDLKWLLKFAAVPVIAAAMLFAGIFVPAKKSAGPVDPGYTITDLHETALKNLISDVEGSSMATGLKTFTVLELNGLLDMLCEAEYQSVMKEAVQSAVSRIDGLIGQTNSYLKIDAVFKADDILRPLSRAAVNAVVDYKGRGSTKLTSMSVVTSYERSAADRIPVALGKWRSAYLAEFSPKAEGEATGTPLAISAAVEKLRAFVGALNAKLANEDLKNAFAPKGGEEISPFTEEDGDALYNYYGSVAESVSELIADAEGGDYGDDSSFVTAIGDSLTGIVGGGTAALSAQSYNCMMDDYIRNALARIFGWSTSEFGSNADIAPVPDEDDEGGNGNDKQESGGGYGPGNHIYGSDDKILDTDTGESVSYGEDKPQTDGTYLDYYKNQAEKYVNSGTCSPEVAAFISRYFGYLENGLEQGDN